MKVLRVLCVICALVAACTQSELGAAAPASAGTGALGGTTTVPPTLKPAPSAHSTLAELIGQKLIVRMQGLTPSAGLLGRIRRGEVGGVILFGENVTTPAALVQLIGTLRAAAAAGDQPRAPDRGRPGGRADQAHPVGAADPVTDPDGRERQHVGGPDPGRGHRSGAPRAGHRRRLRAGRRRPGLDLVVHVQGRADVLVQRDDDGRAVRRVRQRARDGAGRTIDEALPGDRLRDPRHRFVRGHDHGLEDRARARAQAVRDGDRPPHPDDHALERDVSRLRQRQCGRLVARDRR